MKILHTEASDGWGGQEIRILSEAIWFRENGHEVVLCGPEHGELHARANANDFRWVSIPFNKKSQFKDFFRLKSLLKKEKFDVVATHSSVDTWVGILAARAAKVPRIVRYRHVSTAVSINKRNKWQYGKGCDFIITTAGCIKRKLCTDLKFPSNRIASIPTGINIPDPLPEREASRKALIDKTNAPPDTQWIGQVSVLRSWKGHDTLIRAFDILAEKNPKLRLAIAGGGPGLQYVEGLIAESSAGDRIHLMGHIENPWWFFRALDIVVLASTKNEGVPQSLMQAMFAEVPIVGSDVGGIPEIVSHRQTGLLVPPSNPEALARKIEDYLHDRVLREVCIGNALTRARHSFTINIMGKHVEEIMQQK